jgi:hypothetical protein
VHAFLAFALFEHRSLLKRFAHETEPRCAQSVTGWLPLTPPGSARFADQDVCRRALAEEEQ